MPSASGPSALPAALPSFPPALLQELRAAAPEGCTLRVGLWNGEVVALRSVVAEHEGGLLGEVETEGASAQRTPALVAVPWHAIARVEMVPAKRRMHPGFAPPSAGE